MIKRYKSEFSDPLVIKRGEKLQIRPKETNFKGWIWCKASDGNSGWVPEKFVRKTDDSYMIVVDYDATELSVSVDEELTILSEESEWVLCYNSEKQKGWVPLENVKKL